MSYKKIKRMTRIEISSNCPNIGYKDALKYYKAGHNNG
jgi:hypothetical protein